jgi:hypothetical protein
MLRRRLCIALRPPQLPVIAPRSGALSQLSLPGLCLASFSLCLSTACHSHSVWRSVPHAQTPRATQDRAPKTADSLPTTHTAAWEAFAKTTLMNLISILAHRRPGWVCHPLAWPSTCGPGYLHSSVHTPATSTTLVTHESWGMPHKATLIAPYTIVESVPTTA